MDFNKLKKIGVDACNGRVVIARLGKGSRNSIGRNLFNHCSKVMKHRMSGGLLIYPDPEEYVEQPSEVWPNGRGLPGDAPIFGNVAMKTIGGGDLATIDLPAIGRYKLRIYYDNLRG